MMPLLTEVKKRLQSSAAAYEKAVRAAKTATGAQELTPKPPSGTLSPEATKG